MNKHRIRRPFRHEYIRGVYSGLTEEEREWRVWYEMDREEIGYEELVERLRRYHEESSPQGKQQGGG